jgi:hypothetical protein
MIRALYFFQPFSFGFSLTFVPELVVPGEELNTPGNQDCWIQRRELPQSPGYHHGNAARSSSYLHCTIPQSGDAERLSQGSVPASTMLCFF